jgi:hypothetical protein
MNIYFDIDSTLCLTVPMVLNSFRRVWHQSLPLPTDWDAAVSWPHLTPAQLAWLDNAYVHPFTAANAAPIEGAITSVQAARERGWQVRFRSSRPADQYAITRRWLEYYGFIARNAADDVLVCASGSKVTSLLAHQSADARVVFLDDSPSDLTKLHVANTRHDLTLLCFDQPWNGAAALPEGTVRIADHDAMYTWIVATDAAWRAA